MLSMKAKYALKALMILANEPKKRFQTGKLAEESAIPMKFLEAIMVELKNHGLLDSKRGATGGHTLAKPPAEIYIGDIMRIIDGPLAPVRCASLTAYKKCDDCTDEANCVIRHIMLDVREAMSGVLDKKSLQDLVTLPDCLASSYIV
jgi:Rrf2 family protein